jgi:hypothetical protein
MRGRALAGPVINQPAAKPQAYFANQLRSRRILRASASAPCTSRQTRCRLPPRAHCGQHSCPRFHARGRRPPVAVSDNALWLRRRPTGGVTIHRHLYRATGGDLSDGAAS